MKRLLKIILLGVGILGLTNLSHAMLPDSGDTCSFSWRYIGVSPIPQMTPGDISNSSGSIAGKVYPCPYSFATAGISTTLLSNFGISAGSITDYDSDIVETTYTNCSKVTTIVFRNEGFDVTLDFPYNPPSVYGYGNYLVWAQWTDTNLLHPLLSSPATDTTVYNYFILSLWGIYDAQVQALGGDSVGISWNTDIPTQSRVKYGLTRNYTNFMPPSPPGTDSTVFDTNWVTNHYEILTSLSEGSTYYFGVVSMDSGSRIASAEAYSFILTSSTSVTPIYYLDQTSGSDITGDGSSDNPWATFGYALDQLSYLDDAPCELRVSQGTYLDCVNFEFVEGLRLKGGYPTLWSAPTTRYGKRDTSWIESHRNPRRYETIIAPHANVDSVSVSNASNGLVDGFTIYYWGTSNGSGGIYGDVSNCTISNNIIISGSTCGYGVAISGTNNAIINNVVKNYNVGLRMGYAGAANMYVLNNTVLNCKQSGIELLGGGINTFTGKVENNISLQNGTGIYTGKTLSASTIDYNCVYNNTTAYYGNTTGYHDILQDPLLVSQGNGKCDGYYLAQCAGDATRVPVRQYALDSTNGIDISDLCLFSQTGDNSILVYAADSINTLGSPLGWFDTIYNPGSDHGGNLLIQLDAQNADMGFCTGDYITLNFRNGNSLLCYIASTSVIPMSHSVWLWVAMDGSTYYADTAHGYGSPNQDAWQAIKNNAIAVRAPAGSSYSTITSPCVNAGDTTITQINSEIVTGGTATNFNRDRGTLDIGFHYDWPFIAVSANKRTFEKGDGTPYIPMGFSTKFPMVEYQDERSLPQVDSYLTWVKAHGFNSMARGFFDNIPNPYGYPDNVTTWYTLERHDSTGNTIFNDATVATWMDNNLNLLDNHQMTYWLGQWVLSGVSTNYFWDSTNQRSHFNFWYSGSTVYYGVVTSPIQVLSEQTAIVTAETTLQYYIDHWGDRAGILLWDPMPELNYIGDIYSKVSVNESIKINWINQIAGFIHSYETKKWGHSHIISVSSGAANPGPIGSDATTRTGGGSIYFVRPMYAASQGIVSLDTIGPVLSGNSTNYTDPIYFQHPALDVVNTHPIYVTVDSNNNSTLPVSFPLWAQATSGGPSSNWYDSTSQQYLIDSACDIAAYDMFQTIKLAFSMTTTTKPYICTFMGPGDYEAPWATSIYFRGDITQDNSTTLNANSICSVDRHINENLYDEYFHFMGWANLASGAAGEGYHYGMYVNNLFYSNFTAVHNGNVCYTTNGTTYRNNPPAGTIPPREYNGFDDTMMNDHLARANIINQFNWAGLTQWVNQNASQRIFFTGGADTQEMKPIYSGDSQNLLIWVIQDSQSLGTYSTLTGISDATIHITGLPSYNYSITWYESTTGNNVGTYTTPTPITTLTTTVPYFFRDIVAIIKPQ